MVRRELGTARLRGGPASRHRPCYLTWIMPAEGVIVDARDAGQVPWPAFCFPAPSARNRVLLFDRAELAHRLRLYVITDGRVARGRSLVEIPAAALAGGATAIH